MSADHDPEAQPPPTIPDRYRTHFAAHLALYRSDPDRAHMWDSSVIGVPGPVATLMLTTTGRKSGEPRSVTLQYFRTEGKVILAGTQGGAPTDPFWVLNLRANPDCEVHIGGFHAMAVARVAEGAERERLWRHASTEQPRYQAYQARTERVIPVVVLDFVAAAHDFGIAR